MSSQGPLYSTLVPLGGLQPVGYLEVIIDPAFNLPDIGKITKTPINVFSMSGEQISTDEQDTSNHYLPVEFIMLMPDAEPAFRIVGYEDVDRLNAAMKKTQVVTTSGFLLLTLATLLFALWLFNRFLFIPVGRMVQDMRQIANGKLDLAVNKKGPCWTWITVQFYVSVMMARRFTSTRVPWRCLDIRMMKSAIWSLMTCSPMTSYS
jgi:hypothetical protein